MDDVRQRIERLLCIQGRWGLVAAAGILITQVILVMLVMLVMSAQSHLQSRETRTEGTVGALQYDVASNRRLLGAARSENDLQNRRIELLRQQVDLLRLELKVKR